MTITDEAVAPASAPPLLQLRGVHAGYGAVTVLRDVDLTVRPGEITALLGPNGAGKTTLLLACSGLVRVSAGAIELEGRAITNHAAHRVARQGLVHIPEDRSLWPTLSVDEHLRLTRRSASLDVYDLFPEIARMKNKRAGVMSGGEQQMLALARALVAGPDVLLVDEMSMGLAPVVVERLFDALRAISQEKGIAVLVVEQHVHLALKYAERAYVLSGGRITTSGTAQDVHARWSDIQASYLGRG